MPLILFPIIVAYIVLVVWGTMVIVRRQSKKNKKWLLGLLLPVLFFVGPFSDEFIARSYFYNLCSTQGGLKVYEKIELEDKFFNSNGEVKLLSFSENIEDLDVLGRYQGYVGRINKVDTVFNIREVSFGINDVVEKKIVAEVKMFLYGYGFVMNRLMVAMPGQSIKCSKITSAKIEEMLKQVFIKKEN